MGGRKIKGSEKKLIGIAEGNIPFRGTRNDRNTLFVFRLFDSGNTKGIVFPSSRAKVRDERGVYINVVVITLSLWHAANFVSFSKIRFSPGAIYLLNLLSLLRNNDATLVINRS